jgi:membrane protein DedA with SNARE-associated domain
VLDFFTSIVGDLIQTYGLLIVFLFVAVESAGIPMPGETALITAALYAGTTHRLSIIAVIATAAAAAIVGDTIGYLIGRTFGRRVLHRYGSYVGLNEDRLMVGEYLFLKHGGKIVFIGRFVALLRVLAALLAGANSMPWPQFFVANALGGIAWAIFFGGGAYLLGQQITRITGPLGIAMLFLALTAIVVGRIFFRRHERELEDRAREALRKAHDRHAAH